MGRPKSTHCKLGHSLVEGNLFINVEGRRQCRVCRQSKNRESKLRCQKFYPVDYELIRKQNLERKIKVLTHYGPDGRLGCCWPDCSVEDVDMLSLDHINDDGASHRRTITQDSSSHGGGGTKTYRDVEKRGFPEGFQTLCLNHQMKKQLQRYKNQ
jgi:hypothetical protein